ncbi:hypothetical protein RHGRI_035561 [Rhododendron griersonianum]|uniref:Uncharacterized protein n=1 Tax=Rhododendron griersonianum TaxID=479676 RepID=A0AAV6HML0_9ERIC|nr:hypothetical protein RHGRI_035561 [Rhododendron griersonianum]
MTSTPSSTALSKPARMSESKQPTSQHTLYTAILALGAIPTATPAAKPKREALATSLPAAVEAV